MTFSDTLAELGSIHIAELNAVKAQTESVTLQLAEANNLISKLTQDMNALKSMLDSNVKTIADLKAQILALQPKPVIPNLLTPTLTGFKAQASATPYATVSNGILTLVPNPNTTPDGTLGEVTTEFFLDNSQLTANAGDRVTFEYEIEPGALGPNTYKKTNIGGGIVIDCRIMGSNWWLVFTANGPTAVLVDSMNRFRKAKVSMIIPNVIGDAIKFEQFVEGGIKTMGAASYWDDSWVNADQRDYVNRLKGKPTPTMRLTPNFHIFHKDTIVKARFTNWKFTVEKKGTFT